MPGCYRENQSSGVHINFILMGLQRDKLGLCILWQGSLDADGLGPTAWWV